MLQRKHQWVLVIAFVSLGLNACRVGKDFRQPALELPAQYSYSSFADTSTIADIEWSRFFSDPVLQGLIGRGITYNNDLLIAIKRMDMAGLQVKQARYQQLPDLNLQVTGQYSRPSDNSLNGISIKNFLGKSHVENYNVTTALSWEADIWGKIRNQQDIARTDFLRSREAVKTVQTKLVADIAQGFFNLLMLDKQLEIARRNLSLNDSFLVATRLLKDAGLVTALAVQQAESQMKSTAILIPELEQEIALQENAIQLLTGQFPGTVVRNGSLSKFSVPAQLAAGLPVALVSRRPDVRESELALAISNSRVGIAQANMYPALNLTLGGGLESFKASNWFNIPNSLFGLVAGAIAQPIFNKKQLKTTYETAKLQREEAVIRFRQSVLLAVTEVNNALVQVDKLRQERQLALGQVDTLRKAVTNAQLLFKSDMANYLEVITAQANALQAELNLASIQRRELGAMVELYRALGGGWR